MCRGSELCLVLAYMDTRITTKWISLLQLWKWKTHSFCMCIAIFCHAQIRLYAIQIYSVIKITFPDKVFVDLTPSAGLRSLLHFTGGVFGSGLQLWSSFSHQVQMAANLLPPS